MTNKVKQAKLGAIEEWDDVALKHVKRGNYGRGFAAWSAKQLAKAGPESWRGLALDVVGVGGGTLLIKAARALPLMRSAALAVKGERMLTAAARVGEVTVQGAGKGRYVVRGVPLAKGISSGVASPALSGTTRAVGWVNQNLPLVRRLGQAAGKIVKGLQTDRATASPTPAGPRPPAIPKPRVEQGIAHPGGAVYFPKSREWVFPPTVIQRSKGHRHHPGTHKSAAVHKSPLPPPRPAAHSRPAATKAHARGSLASRMHLRQPALGRSLAAHRPALSAGKLHLQKTLAHRPSGSLGGHQLHKPRLGASLHATRSRIGHASHRAGR